MTIDTINIWYSAYAKLWNVRILWRRGDELGIRESKESFVTIEEALKYVSSKALN